MGFKKGWVRERQVNVQQKVQQMPAQPPVPSDMLENEEDVQSKEALSKILRAHATFHQGGELFEAGTCDLKGSKHRGNHLWRRSTPRRLLTGDLLARLDSE